MSTKSATLLFQEGASNKTYQLQIDPVDGGFLVNFQYGRTGATLRAGTKTKQPVTLSEAEKLFSSLLKEKTAKGYKLAAIVVGKGAVTAVATTEKVASGLTPQLPNPIEEAEALRLIEDGGWFMQEKADGRHQMARIVDGQVTGTNRKGEVIGLALSIAESLSSVFQNAIVDGEAIGDTFYVFDLLEVDGQDLRKMDAWNRWERLTTKVWASPTRGIGCRTVRTARTATEKRELFEQIQKERGEGVVFKKIDAQSTPSRPNSGGTMLKHKFKASATCVVISPNGTKSSIVIGVRTDDGGLMKIGHCTIPPNRTMPGVGQMVEIEYLYAVGSLVQAVYKGVREDKDVADLHSTLKFKQDEPANVTAPAPVHVPVVMPAPVQESAKVVSIDRADRTAALSSAANKAWATRRYLESRLANDEASTDEQLLEHFVQQGVSRTVAQKYITRRGEFLKGGIQAS